MSLPAGGRAAFAVAFFGLELGGIAYGQRTPDHALGFQMFNESSRLTIHLFREVERKGRRVLVPLPDGHWRALAPNGQRLDHTWQDRVGAQALPVNTLGRSMRATYGLSAQLFRLQAALDDVVRHLATDTETRALVAKVETLQKRPARPGRTASQQAVKLNWLNEERNAHVLGLMRVAFSLLLSLFTVRLWRELLRFGYFGDFFHMPLLPESFVASRPMYVAVLAIQTAGCLLSLVGVLARPALLVASLCGLYGVFCDRLGYHNNRYELLLLALLVALSPCDRSFVLWGNTRPGTGPRWAARLVAAQLAIVYLSSSLGKLFDADWRSGVVLLPRLALGQPLLERYVPASWAAIVSMPWFALVASLVAICSELFLALGLWFPKSRVLCLWLGLMFHVGIEISARVELFSYTMLSGYLVFVTPELRERTLSWNARSRAGPVLGALFSRLDLLARFRHERVDSQGALLVVRDRVGAVHRGLSAWRELARASPLLFPLWLPLSLLTWRERVRTS